MRPWNFDGFGVNGGDEFGSRIATLTEYGHQIKAGPVLAAAPELLEALTLALPYVEMAEDDESYKPGAVRKMVNTMRAAISKATGGAK